MEEIRISLEDAQRFYNKSRSILYDRMKEGSVKFVQVGSKREIIVNKDEYDNFLKKHSQFSEQESDTRIGIGQYAVRESDKKTQQTTDLTLELLRQLNNTQDKLLSYSEQAGQVKLLEDSENRTRMEYVQAVQKIGTLEEKVRILEESNRNLKEQLEKKSGFLGLFKK